MVVAERGAANLGRWIAHERDVAADVENAFGMGAPPVTSVSVSADTDDAGESTAILVRRRGVQAAPEVTALGHRQLPRAGKTAQGLGIQLAMVHSLHRPLKLPQVGDFPRITMRALRSKVQSISTTSRLRKPMRK